MHQARRKTMRNLNFGEWLCARGRSDLKQKSDYYQSAAANSFSHGCHFFIETRSGILIKFSILSAILKILRKTRSVDVTPI
jgi:hypothetical protein